MQCEHFSTVCCFGWKLGATDTDALMDKSVGPPLFALFWDRDFFDRDFSELRSRGVCAIGGLLDDRTLCTDEPSEVTVVRRLSVCVRAGASSGSSTVLPPWLLRSVPVEAEVGGESSDELARGDSAEA